MSKDRYGRRAPRRESVMIIAMISLVGQVALGGLADVSAPQPPPGKAQLANSLPSKIITTDGKTFNGVRLLKVQPDGLLVEYRPDAGGLGLTTLKFARLPESLQKQFGYDPRKASDYEHEQKLVTFALTQKLRQEEKAGTDVSTETSERPNVTGAVSVNNSNPTVAYTYYAPGQKPVDVGEYAAITEHQFTCHADFTFQDQPDTAGKTIRLSVKTVTITLGLSTHITEPQHPYDFLSRHEEGHRKIYEYYYRFGPEVAKRIGESTIGREFSPSTKDFETAKAEILPAAEAMVERQYLFRIDSIARVANQYYDQLADPSRTHVDVDQAVQQAIAKYGKPIDSQTQIPLSPPPFSGRQVTPPAFPPTFPGSPN